MDERAEVERDMHRDRTSRWTQLWEELVTELERRRMSAAVE